jgi:soluble lytic murein transglycosylase-like protein
MRHFCQITLFILISLTLAISHYEVYAAKGKVNRKSKQQVSSGDVWERVRRGLRIPTLGTTYDGIDAISAPPRGVTRKPLTPIATNASETTSAIDANSDKPRLTTIIAPKKPVAGESQLSEKLLSRHTINATNSKLFKKDSDPYAKYTPLGRLRLAAKNKSGSTDKPAEKSAKPQASAEKPGSLKSPVIQRMRTRLDFHPELAKSNAVNISTTAKTTDANGNAVATPQQGGARCADLNNRDLINLAQQGMLPYNYLQIAEQCKLKKSTIFERVNHQIAGFSQHISFVNQSAERARPYLYHIVDELTKHGLPLDLALLPIVESGYQPTAFSSASAAGVWQFIPSTGRDFDLEQRPDYDARLDITAATHAAVRFLSGLRDHYHGDWLLALAAYNCGQGTVDAAIGQNMAAGLDADYWSLNLPTETQDYVPRLLALSTMFANPSRYGVKLRPLKNEPYFIKVVIDNEFDIHYLSHKKLESIAKLANFSGNEFGFLNAAFLNAQVPGQKPFNLLMPISHANQLHQSLAFMAKSRDTKLMMKADQVLIPSLNQLAAPQIFTPDIQQPWLAIARDEVQNPITPPVKTIEFTSQQSEHLKSKDHHGYLAVHYLDKGESLKTIAENHGINEEILRDINKLKRKQKPGLGYRLLIPIEQFAAAPKHNHPSILYKHSNAIDG